MYYPRDYSERRILLPIVQWSYHTFYCDFETISAGLYVFLSFGLFTFLFYVLSSLHYISPVSAFYLICTSLYAILSLLHKIFHFHGDWKPSCCLLILGNWITFRKDLLPPIFSSQKPWYPPTCWTVIFRETKHSVLAYLVCCLRW